MAATAARAFLLSRDLSPKHHPPPSLPSSTSLAAAAPFFLRRHNNNNFNSNSHHHHAAWAAAVTTTTTTVSCLSSGGGISDEFVSTRKSSLDRGFSVIANMLKRIEPLDNSIISKGVSDSSKDSMKQTISTMLGILPSADFSVTIRFAKLPLDSLLISAIITGYTLWNAEYRMSLTRNLEISMENWRRSDSGEPQLETKEESDVNKGRVGEVGAQDVEISPQVLGDLPQEALNYIQRLESELSDVKEELKSWEQEITEMENGRGNKNCLLEYLRSLDPDMVKELSRPSSIEVEDIIHQLVQSTVQRFFKDEPTLSFMGDSVVSNAAEGSYQIGADEFCSTIGTSRDYLAKLLFWCMLLGHHLRGLENRLQLSCVVGLL
ncbi:unnamed protein product [Linum trigynum]|uniref:Seed maturation-like protein n=1 Tax=Linum trigynum TaxID=586398 RepID=A0AAV2CMU3_9ROSI